MGPLPSDDELYERGKDLVSDWYTSLVGHSVSVDELKHRLIVEIYIQGYKDASRIKVIELAEELWRNNSYGQRLLEHKTNRTS